MSLTSSPGASQVHVTDARSRSTHTNPVIVFDATTQEEAALRIYANAEASDNPVSSEVASHIGGQGNLLCRKCDAGGTDREKESNDGFEKLFSPGNLRNKDAIIEQLIHQIFEACSGVAKRVQTSQTETGVKDTYTQYFIEKIIDEARTLRDMQPEMTLDEVQQFLWAKHEPNMKEMLSPFLTLEGFDPSQDTPIELLHTILLGLVKYAWHPTHTKWNTKQKQTYALRLQATNRDGLSVHPIRANYVMQYANSLIGRQLKTIIQTAVFHVHDLISETNLEQYLADVQVAIANVLDVFAGMDPSKLLEKIKLHLLNHICKDIRRFGPLLNEMTESFECFNAIFRACSVLSNHLAPSRDIANQFGDLEGFKHRLTGGWWADDEGGWIRAGTGVRDFMQTRPMLQTLLGWSDPEGLAPGTIKLAPLPAGCRHRPEVNLLETDAAHALNLGTYEDTTRWLRCTSAVSQSSDECFLQSWIYADSPIDGQPITGRIAGIFARGMPNAEEAIAVLDVYHVSSQRHDVYGMPVLIRRQGEAQSVIVLVKNLKFKYNVQHDCANGRCSPSGARPRMQERRATTIMEDFIEHGELDHWIINTLSFHNAHLIRDMLPRSLWAPIALHEDREVKHIEFATALREQRHTKRAAQKAKAEAKKAANQAERDNGMANGEPSRPRKRKRQSGVDIGMDIDT
ncbi:uncharacterized protein B0H18DRAFT_1213221 [Fomitopsis serialis]|uniref:uncharacterized protein n=1 Tax=Fomitopsis serialis TaxID=139415 RepID=UPI00200751C1|nr:uncharacterized protein B0H18DRAFT_1213221 [Neoantrodia serialis]KAH9920950.1 hypothetical protein B0H18DRAFT_1213221 [Neoantrodia serialis]